MPTRPSSSISRGSVPWSIGAGLLIAVPVFCGGFGYWRGYANGWADRTGLETSVGAVLKDKPEDARLWAELMKWNPISEEVSRCTPMTAGEAHRKACQVFMWMEAPKAPT